MKPIRLPVGGRYLQDVEADDSILELTKHFVASLAL
jgi:hypothetical protein